jgi:hypothetical protein
MEIPDTTCSHGVNKTSLYNITQVNIQSMDARQYNMFSWRMYTDAHTTCSNGVYTDAQTIGYV